MDSPKIESIYRSRAELHNCTIARVRRIASRRDIRTPPGRLVTAPVSRKLGGGERLQCVKQSADNAIGGVDTVRRRLSVEYIASWIERIGVERIVVEHIVDV